MQHLFHRLACGGVSRLEAELRREASIAARVACGACDRVLRVLVVAVSSFATSEDLRWPLRGGGALPATQLAVEAP